MRKRTRWTRLWQGAIGMLFSASLVSLTGCRLLQAKDGEAYLDPTILTESEVVWHVEAPLGSDTAALVSRYASITLQRTPTIERLDGFVTVAPGTYARLFREANLYRATVPQ